MTAKSYAAFISYSHAVDGALAPAIKAALQRLAKPWYRRRTMRVFHDQASLSVNPGLWSTLQTILSDSEYFVLLASPESAASDWVNREVEYWLRHAAPARLLIVLTDGEIAWDKDAADFDWKTTTAVSRALAGVFHEEPLYLDLRWARSASQLSLKHPPFHAAMADLAATVRGWPKDDLVGEDLRQHRHAIRLAWSAAAALAILALIASSAAVLFFNQRDLARQRELEARQHLYTAHINQALVAVGSGDIGRAATILALHTPQRDEPDLRGFEWYYLWGLSHRELATYQGVGEATVAYSPDGRYLAAGGATAAPLGKGTIESDNRGQVRVWDVASGRLLVTKQHDRPISAIAFALDGRSLAAVTSSTGPSGLDGDDVLLLKTETGEVAWTARERCNLAAVAFHPGGRLIATGGSAPSLDARGPFDVRGQLSLWDTSDGTRTDIAVGPIAWIRALAFSPRGDELAIASDLGPASGHPEVWIWSLTEKKVTGKLPGTGLYITSVKYSADGTRLIVAGDEGVAVSWHLPSKSQQTVFRGHRGPILSVAAAANGQVVATGGWDRTVRLWDWRTGQAIGTLPTQANAVLSVALSPDNRILATSANAVVKLWNVSRELGEESTLSAHTGGLNTVGFSSDGRLFGTGGADGRVRVWDVASKREVMTFESGADATQFSSDFLSQFRAQRRGQILSLAFSPKGQHLAATGQWGTRVWDLETRRIVFSDPDSPGESLVWPDGTHLAFTSEQGVFLIDLSSSTKTRFGGEGVETIALSPDGRLLATATDSSGSGERRVQLWNTSSRHRVCDLAGHDQGAHSLAFSPDGRLLASAGSDARVRIWNVTGCTEHAVLPEQKDPVGLLTFSPDGRTLAGGRGTLGLGDAGSISLWSTATWEELFLLPAGMAGVNALAFSPTGNVMVAGGDDHVLNQPGKVTFWVADRF